MKKNRHKSSLKSKFFVSMNSITTIIVVFLLTFMMLIFYSRFINMQRDASVNQLAAVKQQMNYYVTSMDSYAKMMISDKGVQTQALVYRDDQEEFTATNVSALRGELMKFLQSTPYVHSACVYGLDYRPLASTLSAAPVTALRPGIARKEQRLVSTTTAASGDSSQMVPTFSLIRPFYSTASGAPLGYIELTITEKTISALYRSGVAKNRRFFITDEHGRILSTDGTYPLGDTFAPLAKKQAVPAGSFYTKDASICFAAKVANLNWILVNEIKLSAFYQPFIVVLTIALGLCLLFILISWFVSKHLSETITKPLYQLISHIQLVKTGQWIPLAEQPADTDLAILFHEFDAMIVSQEKLKNDLIAAQKTKNKIQLDLLQQQVNPHFLYNTLDNISSLAVLEEKEKIVALVANLSEFYRQSLSSGKMIILLKNELELTRAYLQIMQIRYVNKFTYTISCPPELEQHHCLKLLLQPVIENSIYHGIKELDRPGRINIRIVPAGANIQFIITDNGPGVKDPLVLLTRPDDSEHFGLKSIQTRIRLYYGKSYGIEMENLKTGGLKTTMTIPLSKE